MTLGFLRQQRQRDVFILLSSQDMIYVFILRSQNENLNVYIQVQFDDRYKETLNIQIIMVISYGWIMWFWCGNNWYACFPPLQID